MNNYPFIDREKEMERILETFDKDVISKRQCLSYVLTGKKFVGKTRFFDEFLKKIEDVRIKHKIPDFDNDKHVIKYKCLSNENTPYLPFKKIKSEMESREFVLKIIKRIWKFLITLVGVNDIFDEVVDLIGDIRSKSDDQYKKVEVKLFNKYRKFLINRSKNSPIIIFIENIPSIDEYSMKLIESLITSDKTFWGMIVLEEDSDDEFDQKSKTILNNLIGAGKIQRLYLKSLEKSFPSLMLKEEFGENFFSPAELEILFTLSEGCPGLLIEQIEEAIGIKWIYKKNGEWIKVPEFKEKIKPKHQKMLELIIALYEDGVISTGETQLIERMARDWEITNEEVNHIIEVVREVTSLGYKIVGKIGPGIVSKDSYLVKDSLGNRLMLEYVQVADKSIIKYKQREIDHSNLLEAKEIKFSESGISMIWQYTDGRRIREIFKEAKQIIENKNLNLIKQITSALAELHRNDVVHGFIQPESIIENGAGKFFLASFDISLIKVFSNNDLRSDKEIFQYYSPERLKDGEIDKRSDIYSIGVLLYKLLTDRFPYKASTKEALFDKMKESRNIFEGPINEIPTDPFQKVIRKCLAFNPEDRYKDAGELYDALNLIEIEEGDGEEDKKEKTENPIPMSPSFPFKKYAMGLGIGILLFLAYLIVKPGKQIKENIITITDISGEIIDDHLDGKLYPEHVNYLLTDEIQQSSNFIVMNEEKFNKLFGDSFNPEIRISFTFDKQYNLRIEIDDSKGSKDEINEKFTDESEIFEFIKSTVKNKIVKNDWKYSVFTKSWDAFVSFYRGESAWQKLDKASARDNFIAAITKDDQFILAKLRLADVYRFDGENGKAIEQLDSISSKLNLLSKVDSLKYHGLRLRLGAPREIWDAIVIYRQISSHTKRSQDYYELAECYYQVRDNENAIKYYRDALTQDSLFALAWNHLGYCYSFNGEHEKAIEAITKYVRLDSTVNAFDSKGDIYFAAGIYDSAIIAKKEGIKRKNDIDYLYSSLASIYTMSGQFDSAKKYIDVYNRMAESNTKKCNVGFMQALIQFQLGNYSASFNICQNTLNQYDTQGLYRDNRIHWLLGLSAYLVNNTTVLNKQLQEMQDIISSNGINSSNYNEIYKLALHLEALQNINNHLKFEEIENIFDNQIKNKIKDGSQPFGRDFFNNWFGETYSQRWHELDNAKKRYYMALDYNKYYAPALKNLRELYKDQGKNDSVRVYDRRLRELLKNADSVVKIKYGINN